MKISPGPIHNKHYSAGKPLYQILAADLLDEYRILNTIIEEDKRISSSKYALLRGSIDSSQHYSHMGETINGRVWYPLGLLVEK